MRLENERRDIMRGAFDTRNPRNPKFLPTRDEKYIIINEDLEYAFTESELNFIKEKAAKKWIGEIAQDLRRNEWEVLWAYCHLLRKGADIPPLGVRK